MTSEPTNALKDSMGPAFEQLPKIVQEAHLGKIHLAGTVEVRRGHGLARLIASIIGLPESSDHCAMEVHGEHLPDRMVWARSFNGKAFTTEFVRDGDTLIEAMGPVTLRVRPIVENERLRYKLLRASVWKMPLPTWLLPTAIAWEGADGQFYDFEVEVRLPLIGHLISYAGKLTLSPDVRHVAHR